MKKLSKLNINSEKLMKNEELITLRGGYNVSCYPEDPGQIPCFCYVGGSWIFAGCQTDSHACFDRCGM